VTTGTSTEGWRARDAGASARLGGECGAHTVEVALAIFMFGLMACGLVQMGYFTANSSRARQAQTEAQGLARERVEAVKTAGYDAADSMAVTEDYGRITAGREFRRQTALHEDREVGAGMKTVAVTVWWDGGKRSCSAQGYLLKQSQEAATDSAARTAAASTGAPPSVP